MSTQTTNPILDKIRNLLKMADPANGATANEMEIALSKARELMTRHGIEQMQLNEKPEDNTIGQERVNTGRRKRDEDRWIPAVIHQVFDVKVVYSAQWDSAAGKTGGYRHVYVFIGESLDVQAAKIALPLVYEAMKTGLSRYLKMMNLSWTSTVANSFFRGVADGFIKESTHGRQAAMRKFKQEEQDRFAIVLADKKKRIAAWVGQNMSVTTGRRSASRARHDETAHQYGRQVGASIDFTTKIAA
jgi:hypothetical protein